jgi:predicted RNA methylase
MRRPEATLAGDASVGDAAPPVRIAELEARAMTPDVPLPRGTRKRLRRGSKIHFAGDRLFDRLARACCDAECLPRKELHEAWETARRVRRRFRGGRVVDLAAGHGLLAHVALLLDGAAPEAVAVDPKPPPTAPRLEAALLDAFPGLSGRFRRSTASLDAFELEASDVVLSVHACGALTDRVLERAAAAGARVAVLPCCHAYGKLDAGGLEGWLDPALAIDVTRAARLRAAGYAVHTATIPGDITPKNRLLLGWPTPA